MRDITDIHFDSVDVSHTAESDGVRYTLKEPIAVDGLTVQFVDNLFDHGDGLYGSVGTTMRVVTVEEHEQRKENFFDREWSPLAHIYEEQVDNGYGESWDTFIQEQYKIDGDWLIYDRSYIGEYGEETETIVHYESGLSRSEIHTVECIGGGRMFGFDPEEWDILAPFLTDMVEIVEEHGLGYSELENNNNE